MCTSRLSGSSFVTRQRSVATACLSLAMVLALGTAARAQFYVETKLTASDGAKGDWFGSSVAISGNTAIVAAKFAAAAYDDSGSAYLFNATSGNQLFKLTASDAAAHDLFGWSVGISGNTAIVGAIENDVTGAAYLFDVTTGNQLFKLTASDITLEDLFGWSVGISGNVAIVGTNSNDDRGSLSRAAYLFDVSTGKELFKLTASDSGDDGFAFSVAISGNTAIVGAQFNDEAGNNSGAAYLFDVTTGRQLFKLNPADAGEQDHFGISVAISGNTAIIAKHHADGFGGETGAAYLFDVSTGSQLLKLNASDAVDQDFFGSVGISGGTAIVGAAGRDGAGRFSGSAYLFDVDPQSPTFGEELVEFTASDAAERDYFGGSVAIGDGIAIVGAIGNDDAGQTSGSAYLFVSIPEPSGFVLAALALIGLLGFARRRRVAIR